MVIGTGATRQQIEEASNKEMAWRTESRDIPFLYCRQVATFLVPEDARIIGLNDLKRLLDGYNHWLESNPLMDDDAAYALTDRIDALIAGDAS